MTRRIIAFFASSILSVALTIPAMAREVDGTIESIDPERAEVRLNDGEAYVLPDGFDFAAISVGMDVVLIVDEAKPLRLVS